MTKNRKTPLVKAVSWYSLLIPLMSSALLSYKYGTWTDWILIVVPFVVSYPLLCLGVTCVKFCDECMIIIRPFLLLHMKKSYYYSQIDFIKETSKVRSGANFAPGDLYIYIKNKQQPIAVPMPLSSKKQEQLKKLIESNGIRAEWGIYG